MVCHDWLPNPSKLDRERSMPMFQCVTKTVLQSAEKRDMLKNPSNQTKFFTTLTLMLVVDYLGNTK